MSASNTSSSRSLLRKQIRDLRKTISPELQKQYSNQLVDQFKKNDRVKNASCIAVYITVDGELDTSGVINWALATGRKVVLPVVHPFCKGNLLFLNYDKSTVMIKDKYGIPEPELDEKNVVPLCHIDILFTPMVAFDKEGNRLGMGGGYYDRTLKQYYLTGKGAYPIGLAHDLQEVEQLPVETWDVPLPEIITPTRDICFQKNFCKK